MAGSAIIDVGIFLVLLGLAVSIVLVARVARMVRASLPGIHLELGQVNRAVNHVEKGEPTLIQQVKDIRASVSDLSEAFCREFSSIHHRLDVLESKSPTSQIPVISETQPSLFD